MDGRSSADGYQTWLDSLVFDEFGYIPAIIQDRQTRSIIRLGRMNRESVARTLATGRTWLYSRKQRRLWHRADERSAYRPVVEVLTSDDGDALVFFVDRVGASTGGARAIFHPALVRETGAAAVDEETTGLVSLVVAINEALTPVAEKLRVLPLGLEHAFRRMRAALRGVERCDPEDREQVCGSVAALTAELLLFAAVRGVALRELLSEIEVGLAAQAVAPGEARGECHHDRATGL